MKLNVYVLIQRFNHVKRGRCGKPIAFFIMVGPFNGNMNLLSNFESFLVIRSNVLLSSPIS